MYPAHRTCWAKVSFAHAVSATRASVPTLRNARHTPAHNAVSALRTVGMMALVTVWGTHVASRSSSSYTDTQIWRGIGIGVAVWVVVELLHALTGDDPDYVGNCPERPMWLWQIFSR